MKKLPLTAALLLAGCHSTSPNYNDLPSFVVAGSITTRQYDGSSDDLLTGGLGKSGLAGSAPSYSDPANPTAAELRKSAIYNNYRALVDITSSGGYGSLYGPNVDISGNATQNEGRIAGEEWLAYDDDGTGKQNVTMMVQVPAGFDRSKPCIVTATSSGSRGVYGAIATAGEWGLKHNCAVAYTDKGTGMGVHDLDDHTVDVIDGRRQTAAAAGSASNFTAPLSDADRTAFNASFPHRFAVKHAHSQQNPEKDWGKYTLHAVQFAYYVLNQKFGSAGANGKTVRAYPLGHILTIAASVSNGGGASLQAAEDDSQGLITGVVAGEPQIQVASTAKIQQGGADVAASAKPLYDYVTLAALYQGCAAGADAVPPDARTLPQFQQSGIDNRCAGLQAKGLIKATAQPGQSNEALALLQQAGYLADSNPLHVTHFLFATPPVALTYANAYSRASVTQNLCGYSFAAVDSNFSPVAPLGTPTNASRLAQIFAFGNGVPPMSPYLQIINNNDPSGPKQDQVSTSPSTGIADLNVDGAACLRSLWTGQDVTGAALPAALAGASQGLHQGVQQVLRSAKLRGIPTILVQGRADALVPVNHASRAYLGANKLADGGSSPTYYYEVANAQHFDGFIGLFGPSFQTRFVPLHRYVIQGLDLMYDHLRNGTALPPSQVVRTTPRGGTAGSVPPIQPSNVPPISPAPAAADLITFAGGTLSIPN